MEKYAELERLQKLKENGTLNNAEFEAEKQKILNERNTTAKQEKKNKKGIAKIFFILTIVGIIITIIAVGFSIYLSSQNYKLAGDRVELEWKYNGNKERINKEMNKKLDTLDTISNVWVVTAAMTGVFLVLGIGFKIKEKGGGKIVN